MRRPVTRCCLLAVGALALAWWIPRGESRAPGGLPPAAQSSAALPSEGVPGRSQKADAVENRAVALGRLLAKRVTVELNSGPLKDALALLAEKHALPILVDGEAFKTDLQIPDVENQEVRLPKLTGIRLGTVLERLAAQVHGGFLVKADHIALTTAARVQDAVWGTVEPDESAPIPAHRRPRLPLVNASWDRQPLETALRELGDVTGVAVVLDRRRAGPKAGARVTAALINVPADTAARLLANQAGLKAVLVDHALYVTAPDHVPDGSSDEGLSAMTPGPGVSASAANFARQMSQPVSLRVEGVPLASALKDLARAAEANVVLDPQAGLAGQAALNLDLSDVSFETGVRVLAEAANLKAVLLGNVVLVTTPAKAAKLDEDLRKWGFPGGAGTVGAGIGGGIAGGAGLIGLGGGGLLGNPAGFGGNLGALGVPSVWGGATGFTGAGFPAAGPAHQVRSFPGVPQRLREKGTTPQVQPPRDRGAPTSPLDELLQRLARPIKLEKGFDPQTPLKDVLDYLQDRYDLPVLVNTEAFVSDQNQPAVGDQPVRLPPLIDVRLSTVLDRLAAQVQGAYVVQPDHVEFTTEVRAKAAVWSQASAPEEEPSPGGRRRPQLPVVHTVIGPLPLTAALARVAAASGISVVLDSTRAGEKAAAVVSASLPNVAADTAVRLLADQAGLEVVLLDDVLYVTSPANAKAMRAEQAQANRGGLAETATPAPAGAA